MKIGKIAALAAALCLTAACSGDGDKILVVAREEGSGTRSAFVELFDVRDENKNDITVATAETTSSTSVAILSVKDNKRAIAYISLGTLSSDVKALKIDGAAATPENVKNGVYKISRPFLLVYKGESAMNAQTRDFVNFILSTEGQAVVVANNYITTDDITPVPFVSDGSSGKVSVVGSTSVTPLMEKLKEAYAAFNPNAKIELLTNDSSTGIANAADGVCDLGMSSRELKQEETDKGLTGLTIAIDGLAVIVNKANAIDGLTKAQVQGVFKGEIKLWSELSK